MKKLSYILLGLLLTGIASCKKSVITQYGDPATGFSIKFLHTAPGTPAVDGLVNGVKITPQAGVSVTDNALITSITTGINYNYTGSVASYVGLFPGNNYAAQPSGNTAIQVVASTPVPALTSPQTAAPGTVIGSATQNTTNGSAYTVFTLGLPGSATAPVGIKIIPDVFPAATSGFAYVRFVNMVPNASTAFDLTATATLTGATAATTTTFVTGIAYSNASNFIALPVNPTSLTTYTFQMLNSGTTTKFGAVSSVVSLAPGRYYTIVGRGLAADYKVPGTAITLKATARPTLPLTDPNTKLPEIYFAPPQLVSYTNQ